MVMRGLQRKKKSSVFIRAAAQEVLTASEWQQCKAFWDWVTLQRNNIPELRTIFHIPNEGKRSPVTAARLKAIGMVPGVWDYILPVARHVSGSVRNGLIIEFKAGNNGLDTAQVEWGDMMMAQGFMSYVAYDWEDAKVAVLTYLGAHNDERTAH